MAISAIYRFRAGPAERATSSMRRCTIVLDVEQLHNRQNVLKEAVEGDHVQASERLIWRSLSGWDSDTELVKRFMTSDILANTL